MMPAMTAVLMGGSDVDVTLEPESWAVEGVEGRRSVEEGAVNVEDSEGVGKGVVEEVGTGMRVVMAVPDVELDVGATVDGDATERE